MRIRDKANVESTPPLNAIEIFSPVNFSKFCSIFSHIVFSINSVSGISSLISKSLEVFIGKFGFNEGSYLKVNIFTNDEFGSGNELSTTKSSEN